MKTFSNVLKRTLPLLLIVGGGRMTTMAQSAQADKRAAKEAILRNLVESQQYDFKALSVMPLGGRTRQLTTDYDLKVTKESIVSYLPYFGQAYEAPMDPSQGGIQFTSKDFDYKIAEGKKGGWDVVIKPKDYKDIQQMSMNISADGYANLQVISTNRQAISYYGYIMAIPPPKQK
jgi:hypothetical protein